MPKRGLEFPVLVGLVGCLGLGALACEAAAPFRDDAASRDTLAAEAAVDCMPATHPGTVTVVNEVTGQTTTKTLTSAEEPAYWANGDAGRVPVVKSVFRQADGGPAEIFLYGPCDQLLEVIIDAPRP
jgi:hypothetical protein